MPQKIFLKKKNGDGMLEACSIAAGGKCLEFRKIRLGGKGLLGGAKCCDVLRVAQPWLTQSWGIGHFGLTL